MAERVRVREITNDEGNRLLRIVRRDSGSVVTWRRAQIVLLSAQGMDRLKDVLARFAGKTEVQLWVCTGEFECRLALGPRYRVTPCQECWKAIDAL